MENCWRLKLKTDLTAYQWMLVLVSVFLKRTMSGLVDADRFMKLQPNET